MLDQSQTTELQHEASAFVRTHFAESDIVEIRAIAGGTTSQPSRCNCRMFVPAVSFDEHLARLVKINQAGNNIYYGVNPRIKPSGTKSAVHLCRHIWADFDDVSGPEALWSVLGKLPMPTTVINSGHGVHFYWRLSEPISVQIETQRDQFEQMLRALYRDLGSDATQDVSRLLRLPGFLNVKSEPADCTLVQSSADTSYSIGTFEPWWPDPDSASSSSLDRPTFRNPRLRDQKIRDLVRQLDASVTDRSRRDFAVVCGLLRLGLADEEIRQLVLNESKFATDGERYFELTLRNAHEAITR